VDPDQVIGTTLAHSDLGAPECCGCLVGTIRGGSGDIMCNECGAIVRTVPADKLRETLTTMELALDLSTAMCPHCGAVNLFPGFSVVIAFTCQECGEAVKPSDAQRP
jgi:hypothetical protein